MYLSSGQPEFRWAVVLQPEGLIKTAFLSSIRNIHTSRISGVLFYYKGSQWRKKRKEINIGKQRSV